MSLSLTTRVTLKIGDCEVNGTRYYYNNDPNVRIFIPDDPYFGAIGAEVYNGRTLYEALSKAGDYYDSFWGCGDLELELLYPAKPLDAMAWAIRFFIYGAVNYSQGKAYVRPYGNGVWIHEEASKILSMYYAGGRFDDDGNLIRGRMELAPGMMLPDLDEQDCIINHVRNSGRGILEAYELCGCSDILPTVGLLQIEDLIKTTTWHLFTIYMTAITAMSGNKPVCPAGSTYNSFLKICKKPSGEEVNLICPEGQIFNTTSKTCDLIAGEPKPPTNENYILYIALGIAALFLLKGD